MILDLTEDDIVAKLVATLPENWIPDFIWLSPICNKFSIATPVAGGGNIYFYVENGELRMRDSYEIVNHNKLNQKPEKWAQYKKDAELALKMYENSKKILAHFKGIPFAIENPSKALSQYILKEYIKNETHYCAYGFDYPKATSIYSNKSLDLKKCTHKTHNRLVKDITKYADRARVPEDLILDIFSQIMEV